jgi:hypothetical protein
MGLGSLKSLLSNPQRSYLWEIRVLNPQGGSSTTPAMLTVMAETAKIPKRSHEVISIPYKQTAGIVVYGKDKLTHLFSCTFRENENSVIYNMIRKWQNAMIDARSGVANGPYQTDVFCALLDVNGNDTTVIKLKGAWISDIDEPQLSYADGTGLLKYGVTFSYDYFETNQD